MTLGRRKGSAAEREVAESLRAWWDRVEPGCIFKRTPGSGGWSSPEARAAFRTAGDLVTDAQKFPFCVECKRREGFAWATLLAGKPSPVWGWWRQAQRQAAEVGLEPMLWLRHNREPWHVMLPFWTKPLDLEEIENGWSDGALSGVDYGELFPKVVRAEVLLARDPLDFALREVA